MGDIPRIYVACLAADNNGTCHGAWIEATEEVDEIYRQITEMLEVSRAENAKPYAIHEVEGFDGYTIHEHESIETVHDIACFIDEYPHFGAALLRYCDGCVDDAVTAAEGYYCGCYKSLANYAEARTLETTDVPENLVHYIDYERMGKDMERSGDIVVLDGHQVVHIFWTADGLRA